jgi:hypothetical protein
LGCADVWSAGRCRFPVHGFAYRGPVDFDTGIIGGAFRFGGEQYTSGFVKIPDPAPTAFANDSLTLEAWVFAESIDGDRPIVCKYHNCWPPGEYGYSWFIGIQPLPTTTYGTEIKSLLSFGVLEVSPGGTHTDALAIATNDTVIQVGKWYHVAGTFDQATQESKIFVNGVEVECHVRWDGLGPISSIADTTTPIYIGSMIIGTCFPPGVWDGLIDEVAVYNRALTPTEIFLHYAKIAGILVNIDIKPGSEGNPINLRSKGNVPVAVFGTSIFDVGMIDPATVTLAGAPILNKGKAAWMCSYEDLDGDGFIDMTVHFDTHALQLTATDIEAVLEGRTTDGCPFKGKDKVTILH